MQVRGFYGSLWASISELHSLNLIQYPGRDQCVMCAFSLSRHQMALRPRGDPQGGQLPGVPNLPQAGSHRWAAGGWGCLQPVGQTSPRPES